MRVLFISPKDHVFKVECHSVDDLRAIARLLRPGDQVSGETDRNIKPKEPGQKPFRLKMYLTLKMNSCEVNPNSEQLRVTGTIEGGSPAEFVEMHAMHSLLFGFRQAISVQKPQLLGHEMDQLKQLEKDSQKPSLICIVLDDESALVVQVSGVGVKELAKVNAYKSGKQYQNQNVKNEYFESLAELVKNASVSQVIIAGPGFTRQALVEYLHERLPKSGKQFLSTPTSETGMKGVKEAISSDSISKAVGEYSLSQHADAVNEILLHIGKDDGLATYGLGHVENALEAGAVSLLLMSESLHREQNEKMREILEKAKQMGVKYFLLDANSDPGKQLDGLGGLAALLRYRVDFP